MKIEPALETLLPQVELRVLYGPQAGSRLSITPGDYELGSSDDCTIILSGPRMEGSHARLSFDGNRPSISPTDGKVCDAQGNEITDTIALSLGMPVELGGVWIAVDEVDSPWPDPAAVAPVSSVSPVEVPQIAESDAQNTAVVSGENKSRTRAKLALTVSVGTLVLVALSGIAGAKWLIQKGQAPVTAQVAAKSPAAPPIELQVEKIRTLIAGIAAGQAVDVTVSADHKLKVQGYAKDRAMQTKLIQALENMSPQPASQFYVEEDMLEASRQILDTRLDPARARLRAFEMKGGTLSIQGAVASQSVRDATVEMLHTGVPGLKDVTGTVIVAEELPPVFMERLTEYGLTRKMQLISKQPELVLRGTLTEDEMKRWEKLLMTFTEVYGKVLPIRASITLGQRRLPVNVQTIVGGITPYVMTTDGQRTTRGGDTNGHTLVTVKDNEIVFEGGERFRIGR